MRLKRILALAGVALVLFVGALIPKVAYAQSGSYVFDEYGLLQSSDFSELEQAGSTYANEYGVGVYLLITNNMGTSDPSSSERNEFARQYYLSHDLGVGTGKDGIIFVIAVDSRDYVTVKHFNDSTRDPFSNDSVDTMEDEVVSYLKKDKWTDACKAYYETMGEHIEYFDAYGKQWQKPHFFGTIIKGFTTLLVPLMVAFGFVSSEKRAMKTARIQTEASNYQKPNSFNLRVSTDTFLDRTVSVVRRHDDDDSHHGGFSDMGGGFSGSGGGKF